MSGGYSLVAVRELLLAVASLVQHGLKRAWASVVVALGLSCSVTWGIFLDQGGTGVSYIGKWILYH